MKIYQLLSIIDGEDLDMDAEVKFLDKLEKLEGNTSPVLEDVVPVIQLNTKTNQKTLVIIKSTEIPKIADKIIQNPNSGPVS